MNGHLYFLIRWVCSSTLFASTASLMSFYVIPGTLHAMNVHNNRVHYIADLLALIASVIFCNKLFNSKTASHFASSHIVSAIIFPVICLPLSTVAVLVSISYSPLASPIIASAGLISGVLFHYADKATEEYVKKIPNRHFSLFVVYSRFSNTEWFELERFRTIEEARSYVKQCEQHKLGDRYFEIRDLSQ